MASIVGKRRGRRTYYYLVESARVDGEPRIISQQYLGTAEEVLARLSGVATGAPVRTQHKRFGDLAAVWSVLERLDVAGVIDRVVPRRSHNRRHMWVLHHPGLKAKRHNALRASQSPNPETRARCPPLGALGSACAEPRVSLR